jgi:hypothetical protein
METTNPVHFEIKEKLAKLEASLLQSTPDMPTLLRDIHKILKADSELVTILTEEECSVIVSGLKKQTATEIAATSLKKKTTKAMSKITVSDL